MVKRYSLGVWYLLEWGFCSLSLLSGICSNGRKVVWISLGLPHSVLILITTTVFYRIMCSSQERSLQFTGLFLERRSWKDDLDCLRRVIHRQPTPREW